jgi:hypothetical protein
MPPLPWPPPWVQRQFLFTELRLQQQVVLEEVVAVVEAEPLRRLCSSDPLSLFVRQQRRRQRLEKIQPSNIPLEVLQAANPARQSWHGRNSSSRLGKVVQVLPPPGARVA